VEKESAVHLPLLSFQLSAISFRLHLFSAQSIDISHGVLALFQTLFFYCQAES
jgi:hypothetical protein